MWWIINNLRIWGLAANSMNKQSLTTKAILESVVGLSGKSISQKILQKPKESIATFRTLPPLNKHSPPQNRMTAARSGPSMQGQQPWWVVKLVGVRVLIHPGAEKLSPNADEPNPKVNGRCIQWETGTHCSKGPSEVPKRTLYGNVYQMWRFVRWSA